MSEDLSQRRPRRHANSVQHPKDVHFQPLLRSALSLASVTVLPVNQQTETNSATLTVLEYRLCAIMGGVMQRFRALLLLATLLSTPVGVLALSVFPISECCCCCSGTMCPMHGNQKTQQEKMPCHGSGPSRSTCMCSSSRQAQPVVLQFTSKAVFGGFRVSVVPVVAYKVVLLGSRPSLVRSISPPEQPPRL